MCKGEGSEDFDIVGRHIIPSPDGGKGLRAAVQSQGCPWACAQVHVLVRPGSLCQTDNVVAQHGIDVDPSHPFLCLKNFRAVSSRHQRLDGIAVVESLQHAPLFILIGIAHSQP